MFRKAIAVAAPIIGLAAIGSVSVADATPCAEHVGKAKASCVRYRARQRFPYKPTMQEMKARVPDWKVFVCLGRHEQPGNGRWGVRWGYGEGGTVTYGGGTGIYRGTWIASGSPYRMFSSSIAEEILTADAVRDRFGITAWATSGYCV